MVAVLSGPSACRTTPPNNVSTYTKEGMMSGSSVTQAECAAKRNAVWGADGEAGVCIRYYPAGFTEGDFHPFAVVYIHGDLSSVNISSRNVTTIIVKDTPPDKLQARADSGASKAGLPFVYLARPGGYGSSGYQGDRYSLRDKRQISAAIDGIKDRLGIGRLVLVGQSGGGMVVASLLNWRTDVQCAVLTSSSSAFKDNLAAKYPGRDIAISTVTASVHDPKDHVEDMPADPERTIYVIGDLEDSIVPYASQTSYFQAVRNLGHGIHILKVKGRGKFKHGTGATGIEIGSHCAKGVPPGRMDEALSGKPPPTADRSASPT